MFGYLFSSSPFFSAGLSPSVARAPNYNPKPAPPSEHDAGGGYPKKDPKKRSVLALSPGIKGVKICRRSSSLHLQNRQRKREGEKKEKIWGRKVGCGAREIRGWNFAFYKSHGGGMGMGLILLLLFNN